MNFITPEEMRKKTQDVISQLDTETEYNKLMTLINDTLSAYNGFQFETTIFVRQTDYSYETVNRAVQELNSMHFKSSWTACVGDEYGIHISWPIVNYTKGDNDKKMVSFTFGKLFGIRGR